MRIKIKSDFSSLKKKLEKLEKMNKSEHLTNKIGNDMKKEVALRFRREEDPDGKKWEALKGSDNNKESALRFSNNGVKSNKKGKKRKMKRGGNPKILQDTGRLKNSISMKNDKTKAIVGTNVVYAKTHQFGLESKNIPARPFMGLSKIQKDKYTNWINRWRRGELF